MNAFLRLIPGVPAARAQLQVWQDQLADLRPLYPVVIPALLWIFLRSYRQEQARLRLERVDPILLPSKRLPANKPSDG